MPADRVLLAGLLALGGLVHLAVLAAAALVPRALDWRVQLARLDPFLRRLFWVYGAFIAFTILAFGVLALALNDELAAGTPLARAVCAVIAAFWWLRIAVQVAVFDARALLTTRWRRAGYHALSAGFAALAAIFTLGALW